LDAWTAHIRPIQRSRAFELRFDSRDPDLAARAVNAVAENYVQKNLEARWEERGIVVQMCRL
jgi:uncharacterized protein involved in exopolysaccharide biosynthesis